MKATWYCIEDDETIGPMTLDDVARQIRRAGQPRVVWTESAAESTEARIEPAPSQLSRTVKSRSSTIALGRVGLGGPLAPKQATLSQHLRTELIKYLAISAYLFICFGSLLFYKAAVLHSDGIAFASFGIAIAKALVLGKFILVLHALKIGERGGASVLLAEIFKKSVLFVVFLLALTVIEEVVVGYFHGRTSREVFNNSEMAGGTLRQAFAVSILMLMILIPYLTFRGVADRLGEGALWKLLTDRTWSGAARASAAPSVDAEA